MRLDRLGLYPSICRRKWLQIYCVLPPLEPINKNDAAFLNAILHRNNKKKKGEGKRKRKRKKKREKRAKREEEKEKERWKVE